MSDKLIPVDARIAAKRGFLRTTAQAYGTALAGGITTVGVTAAVTGEVPLVITAITLGVTLVSPLLAGGASYFSILSRGIPADYEQVINEGRTVAP